MLPIGTLQQLHSYRYLPRLAGSTRRLPPAAAARPAAGAGVAAGASSSLSIKPPSTDCGGSAVPAVAAVACVGSVGADIQGTA
jgi:hypothetical protein